MDFLNKLALNQHIAEQNNPNADKKTENPVSGIEKLGFCAHRNKYGQFFVRYHNQILADMDDQFVNDGVQAFGSGLKHQEQWHVSLPGLLFMDIETTSLQAGAGNVVFLVGIGYYARDRLHILQFFLHEYAQEKAMLYAINRYASNFKTLVTFNGHGFDIPMLQSRYQMYGLSATWLALPNMDLYHFSRRVYKSQMQRFSLGQLETNVLGIERSEDIPGHEIPAAFFEYQAHGRMQKIHLVCAHHTQDIVSLYFLLNQISMAAARKNDTMILFNLLLVARGAKQTQMARELAARITEMADHSMKKIRKLLPKGKLTMDHSAQYLFELAQVLKELGNWSWAAQLWEQIAHQRNDALLRLAQFYEHQEKDFKQALDWARILEGKENLTAKQKQAAQKRVLRLEEKLSAARALLF